jgi:hypothetical protein
MDLPQLAQNLTPGRTGLPQCGQVALDAGAEAGWGCGLAPGAGLGGGGCAAFGASIAGNSVRQLPQNFAPGRTGFPQLGQVAVMLTSIRRIPIKGYGSMRFISPDPLRWPGSRRMGA